jgi:hypothetical protein
MRCDGAVPIPESLESEIQQTVEAIAQSKKVDQINMEFIIVDFTTTAAGGGKGDIPIVLQRPSRVFHIANVVTTVGGVVTDDSICDLYWHPAPLNAGLALGATFAPSGLERWVPIAGNPVGLAGFIGNHTVKGCMLIFGKPVQRFFLSAYAPGIVGRVVISLIASDDIMVGHTHGDVAGKIEAE